MMGGADGTVTFRVRFKEFTGKTVYHCHITPHEDTGMMQNILMV
jgi:suppressor of ftsI